MMNISTKTYSSFITHHSSLPFHLPQQKGAGAPPFAADGVGRDLEDFGRLLDREAAEVAQLDDARLALVNLLQLDERLVERNQLAGPLVRQQRGLVERKRARAAAALLVAARARVVNQDAAHRLRGDGEEVCAVLPADARLTAELEVSLIDECGGLERVPLALAANVVVREPMQLALDEREQ